MSQIDDEIALIRRMACMAAIEDTAREMAVTLLCSWRVIPTDGNFCAVTKVVRAIVEKESADDVALQRLHASARARLEESEQEAENVLGVALLSVVEGLLIWHAMTAQMTGKQDSSQRKGWSGAE